MGALVVKNSGNPEPGENAWLPWEPFPLRERRPKGGVLSIIPSKGEKIDRLAHCITSLRWATESLSLRVVVVVSPRSERAVAAVNDLCLADDVLAGAVNFNYCSSINLGLSKLRSDERYVLFLNDDAHFVSPRTIDILAATLEGEDWCCVGPHIRFNKNFSDPDWPPAESGLRIPRGTDATRVNRPVSGCCALWRADWVRRLGPLDEMFGVGWGLDEADHCLRAVRMGGRYGHQDSVEIEHEMRGTVGDKIAGYRSPARQISVEYFRAKYGTEVSNCGNSDEWWPLPGFTVLLWLDKGDIGWCISRAKRLKQALAGFRWVAVLVRPEHLDRRQFESARQAVICNSDPDEMFACPEPHEKGAGLFQELSRRLEIVASSYPASMILVEGEDLEIPIVSAEFFNWRDAGVQLIACQGLPPRLAWLEQLGKKWPPELQHWFTTEAQVAPIVNLRSLRR